MPSLTIQQALQQAMRCRISGLASDAESIYRSVLAHDPDHPESLHALGVMRFEAGDASAAAELIASALKRNPNNADFQCDLGTVLMSSGNLTEATASFRRAISINPNLPVAHYNLGNALKEAKQFAEAAEAYRYAIALDPANFEAHSNLATVLLEAGKPEEAVESYHRAAGLRPDLLESHTNLATALVKCDKFAEAATCYRKALVIAPDNVVACTGLGTALQLDGKSDEAICLFRRALDHQPDNPDALHGLGIAQQAAGRLDEAVDALNRALILRPQSAEILCTLGASLWDKGSREEAIDCFRKALRLRPEFPPALVHLGHAFQSQERPREASDCLRRAIASDPNSADLHYSLAMTLLANGEYEQGWAEHEWRMRMKSFPTQFAASLPLWRGEALHGRSILLEIEQGYGDFLQFVRYAKQVAERGGRVVLRGTVELESLLRSVPGVERVVVESEILPLPAVRCPVMSLPFVLGTTLETIPNSVPYLSADPARMEKWRARLDGDRRLKVGLVWAGRSTHPNDSNRSLSLSKLAPLLKVPAVHFVSLQKGPASSQVKEPPPPLELTDWADDLHDFADTAALVAQLDLVVAVDTAVAHLAGALAKPTWLLLPFNPDFRWMLNRDDIPWYPTMRLFRQTRPGEWEHPIERLASELRSLSCAHATSSAAIHDGTST